jgi:hypothetical protein
LFSSVASIYTASSCIASVDQLSISTMTTKFGAQLDNVLGIKGVQAFLELQPTIPYCRARDSTIVACLILCLKPISEVEASVVFDLRIKAERS